MAHALTRAGHASAILLEVIALVWIGKKALELATRTRFRGELMDKDNPATGMVLAGFQLSLFIALSGLLAGEAGTLLNDLRLTAIHGGTAILALVVTWFLWTPLLRVSLREDILAKRNLGAGLIMASAVVATGLIYRGAVHLQAEAPAQVAVFFVLGEGALCVSLLLYEWVTPYNVSQEIGEKANTAAAVSFAGGTIAAGLILGNAVEGTFQSWKVSITESLLYMTPILVLPLVRWVVVNGLFLGFGSVNREIIEDRNAAAGLVEASAYVGVALLAVHLLG